MAQDVAGIFKSDEHRRVLGWIADTHAVRGWKGGPRRNQAAGLALALSDEARSSANVFANVIALQHRGAGKPPVPPGPPAYTVDDINEILLDLEADGYVTIEDNRVKRTAKGTRDLKR